MSWATSAFRWLDTEYLSFGRSSILRWSGLFSSYLAPRNWAPRGGIGVRNLLSWNIVDDVVWSLVTAFESVALVSLLGFFFLFCGCTL
ncbi:hypothetical protein CMV_017854 [Castanea mollissima]|uniref:Uncharacterized protein n=1 Tax=Castanea mollissima TaxID=60419 RepID=A0A8J4R4B7_9ROSI|nr:hypothetical protein CMV_017854 [Castanea mollissima]